MRAFRRDEQGSAVVIAIFVIAAMMMIGAAMHSVADTQGAQAGKKRLGESSFNLTDAALHQQLFQLGRLWPAAAATAYPSQCTPSSAGGLPCPNQASLAASYTGPDYQSGTCANGKTNGWKTTVRDNGGTATTYYDPVVVPGQPSYDANKDGAMWARSDAVAGCQARSVVALVKLQPMTLPFPRNTVTANWLSLTNRGRKILIDTAGTYAQPPSARPPSNSQPGGVVARCNNAPTPCVKYDPSKGQIVPNTVQLTSDGSPTTLTAEQLEGLKQYAQSLGTFYRAGTCPPTLTGALVYVEDFSGCGNYNNGGNTSDNPGFLVFERGTLSLTGNGVFYGLVYAINKANSSDVVVSVNGTAAIQGAVVVDGRGGVSAGSSRTNIVFDARVFDLVKVLARAVIVPNSWRELNGGT